FFFLSSRRRHTRSKRDWSSDVCSSDLNALHSAAAGYMGAASLQSAFSPHRNHGSSSAEPADPPQGGTTRRTSRLPQASGTSEPRSEERRVGREGGAGRADGAEAARKRR